MYERDEKCGPGGIKNVPTTMIVIYTGELENETMVFIHFTKILVLPMNITKDTWMCFTFLLLYILSFFLFRTFPKKKIFQLAPELKVKNLS